MPHELQSLLGREVVFDMIPPYVYLGTLVATDDRFLTLEKADVHDLRDTSTTRELYILDAKRHGIRPTRARVFVKLADVISVSALADVVE